MGIFSLQTGIYLMVMVDIGLLSVLITMLFFNKEANASLMNKVMSKGHAHSVHITNSFAVFLINIDSLGALLYTMKVLAGIWYIFWVSFPSKKNFDFLYSGNLGHLAWRVQRVKAMRNKLLTYFVISTVAVLFVFINNCVVEATF